MTLSFEEAGSVFENDILDQRIDDGVVRKKDVYLRHLLVDKRQRSSCDDTWNGTGGEHVVCRGDNDQRARSEPLGSLPVDTNATAGGGKG